MVTLGNLRAPTTVLALAGMLVMATLMAWGVRAAMLIGIVGTSVVAMLLGIVEWKWQPSYLPQLGATALQLDLKPEMVRSYRLVGYAELGAGEGGGSSAQRGLPPGWSNFVLYELIPANQEIFMEHWVMVRVGLAVGNNESRGSMMVPAMSPPRGSPMRPSRSRFTIPRFRIRPLEPRLQWGPSR